MPSTPHLGLNIPEKTDKGKVVTEVFDPNFTKIDQFAERVDTNKLDKGVGLKAANARQLEEKIENLTGAYSKTNYVSHIDNDIFEVVSSEKETIEIKVKVSGVYFTQACFITTAKGEISPNVSRHYIKYNDQNVATMRSPGSSLASVTTGYTGSIDANQNIKMEFSNSTLGTEFYFYINKIK